ncbi:MAG: hypothetical protein U9R23_04555 [Candidatus Cloacimonadota bacterium]|nr:hypothetical protein [Candidatus Cloacimonadota bacterium]
MKILYVEDELSKNIPKIIKLFSKYLGNENIKELKTVEEDEYVASDEEIKTIVEKSNLIEVEYRFPNGLEKIINNYKKYALFIIDRNLSNVEYDYDEIVAIDPNYNETLYDKFFEREGDYFLQKLVYTKIDVMTKFYFLTAFAKSELRNADEIKTHIDFGKFTYQNIIGKGEEERLKQIIDNIEILNLQVENKNYLDILRTKITEKTTLLFLDILSNKESDNDLDIIKNLGALRLIFHKILNLLAKSLEVKSYTDSRNGKEVAIFYGDSLNIRPFINWLSYYSQDLKVNSLIRNFLFGIQEICSNFGLAHNELEDDYKEEGIVFSESQPSGYQPTANSVNALIYELKEIILWFDEIS